MLKIEFETQMTRLVEFFGAGQFDRKADHYWAKLAKFSEEDLCDAVDSILDDGKNFPSVNQLKNAIFRAKQARPAQSIALENCDICDGYGWVFDENGAYRAACQHGEQLSKLIPQAPFGKKKKDSVPMTERFMAQAFADPMKSYRGFLKTEGILKQINEGAWRELAVSMSDLIGRDRARDLWLNRPEIFEDLTTPPARENHTDGAAQLHCNEDSSAALGQITTKKTKGKS